MSLKQNLIFIGLSGSGKTTVGKYVSENLGLPFLNTDVLIEETLGESIPEIFSQKGEQAFRAVEREIVGKASEIRKAVIATGGGAWIHPESRKLLKESGTVIYLTCSLQELWSRLQKTAEKRPLLQKGFVSLEKLHNERHKIYEEAHYVLDTTGKSPEEIWQELSQKLGIKKIKKQPRLPRKEITVETTGKSYPVLIESGIRFNIGTFLEEKFCLAVRKKPRLFLITNPFVKAICGEVILQDLHDRGFKTSCFILPEGEQHKNLDWVRVAYGQLAQEGFDRGDIIIGLGGGVIGDFAGFVAATYMRGMSLVQVPTTLLAQVDASIGGKTAVNLPEGKNLVGAFYQPDAVLVDLDLLQHLSDHHYRQGLAECIKYGILGDIELFEFFEKNIFEIKSRNPKSLHTIVSKCCLNKAKIVAEDEKEKGLRAVLNLGHTVGHALEATVGYGKLGHGDAVGLGVRAEGFLSSRLGKLTSGSLTRIEKLLDALEFPRKVKFSPDTAMTFLERDKKKSRGEIRFALPAEIGRVEIEGGINPHLVKEAFQYVGVGDNESKV
ncbi:MAG: shikimate kinase / 3-dehydroquinate synthase [Clostridia bacterium]|nr:shikimate kinase / 3-dehydroquinate synthase [Clostridia bacterium]